MNDWVKKQSDAMQGKVKLTTLWVRYLQVEKHHREAIKDEVITKDQNMT